MKACRMFKVFVVLLVLGLAGNMYGYGLYWTGSANGDWQTGSWGLEWAGAWIPNYGWEAGNNTMITNGSCVINSGVRNVADFSMYSNHGDIYFGANLAEPATTADVILTVKSGATLHSNANFDLAYNSGTGKNIVNIESGATVSANGYLFGHRYGIAQVNLAGELDGGSMDITGNSFVNFVPGGKLVVKGDYAATFLAWAAGGQFSDRGVFAGQAGWGTVYGITASYDAVSGVTTAQSVPEPLTLSLLGLGALVLRRK